MVKLLDCLSSRCAVTDDNLILGQGGWKRWSASLSRQTSRLSRTVPGVGASASRARCRPARAVGPHLGHQTTALIDAVNVWSGSLDQIFIRRWETDRTFRRAMRAAYDSVQRSVLARVRVLLLVLERSLQPQRWPGTGEQRRRQGLTAPDGDDAVALGCHDRHTQLRTRALIPGAKHSSGSGSPSSAH